jgi:hypothetical protein
LNVKNGNNTNFNNFNALNNPSLTCIQVDNASWSTTNWENIDTGASFSSECNSAVTIWVNSTVMLEGPFNQTTSLMNTGIHTYLPTAQPYNVAPWNYAGTESVATVPAGVVDWVLVELRQATSPALAESGTIMTKRAAFLLTTGSVVDLDGRSEVSFDNCLLGSGNNLYVVIRHRNHLAVMSNTGAVWSAGVYRYDFTSSVTQAYGGASGFKVLNGKGAMVGGDINHDGNVFVTDYNLWAAAFGTTLGYFVTDLNMDGNVFVTDYNLWAANFGTTISTNIKSALLRPRYFSSIPK